MDPAEWERVVGILERMIPYYERLNLATTFFMLYRWRHSAARTVKRDDDVLEIGSGPGSFARLLNSRTVHCLDPSGKMLRYSRVELSDKRFNLLQGLGEGIPLKDCTVDKVFCLFSFRDLLDREKGAEEALRVLRRGGELVIVDVLKPESRYRKKILDFWLRHGTMFAVRLLVPNSKDLFEGNPYEHFYITYEDFDTETSLKALMKRKGFRNVRTKYMNFGAYMVTAVK